MMSSCHFHFPKCGTKRETSGSTSATLTTSAERRALRYGYLHELVVRRRRKTVNRFGKSLDWIRLVMLGIVLVNLGIFAFHRSFFRDVLLKYSPGMPAVFGGMFLAVIIIKLGRPKLYLDWITLGCLFTAAGISLATDSSLSHPVAQTVFLLVLLASSTLTVYIGVTLNPSSGEPGWITAAGLTGFVCLGAGIVGPWINVANSPDIVLGVDLILLGVGIAGFGFSLKRNGQNVEG